MSRNFLSFMSMSMQHESHSLSRSRSDSRDSFPSFSSRHSHGSNERQPLPRSFSEPLLSGSAPLLINNKPFESYAPLGLLAPRPAQGFSRREAVKHELASILRQRAANLDNRSSHGRFQRGRPLKVMHVAMCHPCAHTLIRPACFTPARQALSPGQQRAAVTHCSWRTDESVGLPPRTQQAAVTVPVKAQRIVRHPLPLPLSPLGYCSSPSPEANSERTGDTRRVTQSSTRHWPSRRMLSERERCCLGLGKGSRPLEEEAVLC